MAAIDPPPMNRRDGAEWLLLGWQVARDRRYPGRFNLPASEGDLWRIERVWLQQAGLGAEEVQRILCAAVDDWEGLIEYLSQEERALLTDSLGEPQAPPAPRLDFLTRHVEAVIN